MSDVITEVANELTQPGPQDRPTVELHFGTVTAVDTGAATISVEIGEDTAVAGLSYLASYAPVVNDKVVLFRAGPGALVVIGSYRPLAGAALLYGVGTPEGTVSAPVGVLYRRTDGGVNTSLYVKQTGTGDTGWGAVPTTNSSPNFTGSVTATGLTVNGAATVTGTATIGVAAVTGTATVDGNFRAGATATTPGAPVRLTGDNGPLTTPAIQFSPDSGMAQIWRTGPDSLQTTDWTCDDLSVAAGATVAGAAGLVVDGNIRAGADTTPVRLTGDAGPLATPAIQFSPDSGKAEMWRGGSASISTNHFSTDDLTAGGSFWHRGATLGFYDHSVVTRPGAYSQPTITGSVSADRNCPDWGPAVSSSPYAFITFDGAMDAVNNLALCYENLRIHCINLTQMVNQLLDDLQNNGLVA